MGYQGDLHNSSFFDLKDSVASYVHLLYEPLGTGESHSGLSIDSCWEHVTKVPMDVVEMLVLIYCDLVVGTERIITTMSDSL